MKPLELMQEIESLQKAVKPIETIYVADGMTGQDAVISAEEFSKRLKLSGIILTKMDGDARGGAAISIVEITKCPIKLIGTSEKMDGLEVFNPERMVNRILGYGDVVSLVESAQKIADDKSVKKYVQRNGAHTYIKSEDGRDFIFLDQDGNGHPEITVDVSNDYVTSCNNNPTLQENSADMHSPVLTSNDYR